MSNDLHVMSAAIETLIAKQDVIAHNLAHSRTDGYRRQTATVGTFETHLEGHMGERHARFSTLQTGIDFTPGPVKPTGQGGDVALRGSDRFFSVETPAGDRAFTRLGRFLRSRDGQLVTPAGHLAVGSGGGPISVPTGDLRIAKNGAVLVDGEESGRLGIVRFEDLSILRHGKRGTLVDPTEAGSESVSEPELVLQSLEGSNVDPMTELTRLMGTRRSFGSKARVVDTLNQTHQHLIRLAAGG